MNKYQKELLKNQILYNSIANLFAAGPTAILMPYADDEVNADDQKSKNYKIPAVVFGAACWLLLIPFLCLAVPRFKNELSRPELKNLISRGFGIIFSALSGVMFSTYVFGIFASREEAGISNETLGLLSLLFIVPAIASLVSNGVAIKGILNDASSEEQPILGTLDASLLSAAGTERGMQPENNEHKENEKSLTC